MSAPRHDLAAEQYVLGGIIKSAGRTFSDCEQIHGSDFYRPQHEQLWNLIQEEYAAGRPVELAALGPRLFAGEVRGVSADYLITLQNACTSVANVGFYAKRVSATARLRRLQQAAASLMELAETAALDDIEEVVEQARAAVDAAVAAGGEGGGNEDIPTFAEAIQDAFDRWSEPPEAVLPTGWHDLDDYFNGGLRRGHLVVIGARPAVGKSVAAAVVASQVADQNVGVLWASLEMGRGEVVARVAANVAGVFLDNLESHRLSEADWQKLMRFRAKAASWPLTIDDRSTIGLTHLRKRARDAARSKAGLGLIVVDYLQLMAPANSSTPRHEQVAEISRGLKILAREFNVPVVALAQVNRGSIARADKRPVMSDLRESGQIEADADEIILLHREDDKRPGEIDFIVEKNRHGRQGTVSLAWAPHFSRIASMGHELTSAGAL
ncbi:replicative DNA helicase [Enterococcus hirae]|uniref:replicative DNA helicase n=1 Tax=Enterococcus hirae TaxID=1354 RepID=UPI001368FF40|nr:DnaB-like helicase C-terminal domain-containing protein [Enterococcus hirae]NAE18212.1 AAA family ATPase [Enterococcus hirae]